jgi:TPR repeat protein
MRLARCLLAALVCLMAQASATATEETETRHSRAGAVVSGIISLTLDDSRLRGNDVDSSRFESRGDAEAAYRLGLMYRNGISVAPDKARAAYWVEVAATRRLAAAMFTLSNMLDEGEGVAMDKAAARRWLEAAAGLEYPEALQQLALTEPDPVRAALLMRQAGHAMMHRGR